MDPVGWLDVHVEKEGGDFRCRSKCCDLIRWKKRMYVVQGKVCPKKVLRYRIREVVCIQTHTRTQSNYPENGELQNTYEPFF